MRSRRPSSAAMAQSLAAARWPDRSGTGWPASATTIRFVGNVVAEAHKALPKPFGVLNGALQGREYLLGATFTVADLNLASICSWSKPIKFDFGPFPNASAWLDRCLGRPSYKAARSAK